MPDTQILRSWVQIATLTPFKLVKIITLTPRTWAKTAAKVGDISPFVRLKTRVEYLDTIVGRSGKHNTTETNPLYLWICERVLLIRPVRCVLL